MWIETVLECLSTIKESVFAEEVLSRRLELEEKYFKAALEVFSICTQYVSDIKIMVSRRLAE